MATKVQIRRDSASDWTSANPTLSAGEIGYEQDTSKMKIGDGSTAWTSLAYFVSSSGGSSTLLGLTDVGSDGNNGQVLTTNGSGAFTFTTPASAYGDSDVGSYLTAQGFANQSTIVAAITDSAPGTLDTLNELAAALGDDANFSTTITNSIATKAATSSLSSVATAGTFASLTSKPTTIAGYGITDAFTGVYSTLTSRPTIALSGNNLTYDGTTVNLSGVGAGGIASVVADTTPQLGGNLDVNGQDIVSASNGDIELDPNGSGVVIFKGNATKGAGQFKLNCENNSHGITIKGPPHSAAASYTLTLPNNDGDANQVLKTDGSGVLSWTTPASAGATSIDDLSDAVYNSTALSLFLGANAGAAVTNSASANVAVGVNAGDSITSANMNVLLGYNAGNAITTGSKNIVIGGQAYNATSSNGSHNILIGYNAEATSTSTNNEMTIGTASGDGLINNVRIPGVDFTMNTTALHYGAEIRADGDVVAYYSSDERLKENIEIIPNALSKVQQIRGVTFDWTDEYLEKQGGEDGYFHRKHDSGVIAQEVEKVLPELVAERPDGTKAVRYEKLVAVLIEAVKELKQEIEELKGEK